MLQILLFYKDDLNNYLNETLPCEIIIMLEKDRDDAIERARLRYTQFHDKSKYFKYKQKYLKLKNNI